MSDDIKLKVAWNALRGNRKLWSCNEYQTAITDQFYNSVASIKNEANIMSKEVSTAEEKVPIEKDHFFPPQTIARMLMDFGQETYLEDYEMFAELMGDVTQTIQVTREENSRLRRQTKNNNGIVYLRQPLEEKYADAGIELIGGRGEMDFPFSLPEDLKECQKKYIKPKKFR